MEMGTGDNSKLTPDSSVSVILLKGPSSPALPTSVSVRPHFSCSRIVRLLASIALIAQASIGADEPDLREQVAALFRPLVAERIALSRDGKHVAYTEYDKGCLCVVILNLEEPHARVRIEVEDARDVWFSREKQPVRMRFLDWAGNGRLVFSQEEERVPQKILMSISGVDANGRNARKLLDAKDLIGMLPIRPGSMGPPADFYRSSVLLGFPPSERGVLHVLARGVPGSARTPPSASTVFGVDVSTGKSTSLGDDFAFGDPVYDQQGRHRITFRSSDLDGNRIFDLIDSGGLRLDEATFGALLAECRFSQANQLRKRSYPVGFDLDPNILWIASNAVGDRFGIYGLDLKARRPTGLALEHPVVDFGGSFPMYPNANLIRDRATGRLAGVSAEVGRPFSVWCDREIAEAQRALEAKFPRRTVRILQWSDARTEFLVQVTGGPDPGRSFVWKKATNLVVEIGRRAPWLSTADLCPSESFELLTPYGARLTGFLTRPRSSRFNPPAALVCFAEDLPGRPHSEFDPEAQVFAALGMLVVRINHRGVRGFGLRHLDALSEAADCIPIDDAVAVLDWLGRRGEVNRRRVATLGRGFGGYLAVRAL